eukprot:3830168-Pleurochrysis_carterae.AAC.1
MVATGEMQVESRQIQAVAWEWHGYAATVTTDGVRTTDPVRALSGHSHRIYPDQTLTANIAAVTAAAIDSSHRCSHSC